jgi:tRNA (adenine22-N1)-methyltransferase
MKQAESGGAPPLFRCAGEGGVRLSKRLAAVASFVPQGAVVADIGTDHGFVPAHLVLSGHAGAVYACDIGEGPLSRARQTAAELGLTDVIRFCLTDGLQGLEKEPVDTAVLAGMGGETMAGILARAPWIKLRGVRLILQPQSKIHVLETWLHENGYAIQNALLVFEDGRHYLVLYAEPGADKPAALEVLMKNRDPLLPAYLDVCIEKLRRKIDGLRRAAAPDGKEQKRAEEELQALLKMKEETKAW